MDSDWKDEVDSTMESRATMQCCQITGMDSAPTLNVPASMIFSPATQCVTLCWEPILSPSLLNDCNLYCCLAFNLSSTFDMQSFHCSFPSIEKPYVCVSVSRVCHFFLPCVAFSNCCNGLLLKLPPF